MKFAVPSSNTSPVVMLSLEPGPDGMVLLKGYDPINQGPQYTIASFYEGAMRVGKDCFALGGINVDDKGSILVLGPDGREWGPLRDNGLSPDNR